MVWIAESRLWHRDGRTFLRPRPSKTFPPGSARETYLVKGTDAFDESFEIAEPNKPFEVYSRSVFTRFK
jgi:hypothetical protein